MTIIWLFISHDKQTYLRVAKTPRLTDPDRHVLELQLAGTGLGRYTQEKAELFVRVRATGSGTATLAS